MRQKQVRLRGRQMQAVCDTVEMLVDGAGCRTAFNCMVQCVAPVERGLDAIQETVNGWATLLGLQKTFLQSATLLNVLVNGRVDLEPCLQLR